MKVVFFEGPDGTGKSTQLKRLTQGDLAALLNVQRFPSGSTYGQAARQSGDPLCAAFSHAADFRLMLRFWRDEGVDDAEFDATDGSLVFRLMLRFWRDEGRRPVLACDRGPLSTMAYQGYAHGAGYDQLKPVIDLAMQGIEVAATIVFYAPFRTCLQRAELRDGKELPEDERKELTGAWQAYESYRFGAHDADGHLRHFVADWHSWTGIIHFIDGTQPEDVIQAQVEAIVRSIIE